MASVTTSLLSLLLLLPSASSAFSCEEDWPDVCPPQGDGTSACHPYAAPLAPGTNLTLVRQQFINALFGTTGGALPSNNFPDAIVPTAGATGIGCFCSMVGGCNASECTWQNNQTRLTFTVSVPVNSSFSLTVNSTALWSLNTSGVTPVSYPPIGPPTWPDVLYPAARRSDVLLIMHNGHDTECTSCFNDYDNMVTWVNDLGYDILRMNMPGWGCAPINLPGYSCDQGHAFVQDYLDAGVPVLRLFLEPVVRAINYAYNVLGYKHVVMAGLSGGGWTTTMLAAIDPRLKLTIPVAGSIPCDFRHVSWDAEQLCSQSYYQIANYSTLYALAALEEGRASAQVLHEGDPCCFHGCHRHDRIRSYNADTLAAIGGAFRTVVTVGNKHEVSLRDRVVIATLLEAMRVKGVVTQDDLDALPFNAMNEW